MLYKEFVRKVRAEETELIERQKIDLSNGEIGWTKCDCLSPLLMDILYDPQTSGGLLISLPSDQAQNLVETLKKEAQMDAWIVGEVVEGPPGKIQII